MAVILFLLSLLVAVGGLLYAWIEWVKKPRPAQFPPWRRVALLVGLCAVTLQFVLFASMCGPLRHFGDCPLQRCLYAELVLMVVALLCVFAWTSRARWWLLTASIVFGINSFYLVLASTAY
jgi:hypothetical protein